MRFSKDLISIKLRPLPLCPAAAIIYGLLSLFFERH
jgi:hypothetical protein